MSDGVPPLPRSEFPIAERYRYLNHALVAPLPLTAAEAMAADIRLSAAGASTVHGQREQMVEAVRSAAAGVMGVDAEAVAFVKNTTEGLAFVANGLDWRVGDRVVVPDREYPSTLFPWLGLSDRGVIVDRVEPDGPAGTLPLEGFAATLERGDGRVRAVALSWVQFERGWRTDLDALAALCHAHEALLCVDLIQGLGVLPCDLSTWRVDFAVAGAQKWLLGPEGIGVLYVAPAHLERLRVSEPGWASVVDQEADRPAFELAPSARRFEGGTHNLTGITGMGASLDLLMTAGLEEVWSWVDHLCDRLVSGLMELRANVLSDRSPTGRSAIVTAQLPGVDPVAAVDTLLTHGVVAKARAGGIRFSPHGWNDESDIDAALEALAVVVTGRPATRG